MSACDLERVEGYVFDELVPDEAQETARHLERCEACAAELRLLRRERVAIGSRRRSTGGLPDFSAVLAQAERPEAVAQSGVPRWVMAAFAAAALLAVRLPSPPPGELVSSACVAAEPTAAMCLEPVALAEASEDSRFAACLLASPAAGGHCL
jgi:anti-sigma factor RsiW